MNRRSGHRFAVAVFVACFIWTPAFAQSEKISLRLLPRPNQIVRMRMVQETDVDVSFDSNLSVPAAAMVPVTLGTKTVVETTQKSGQRTRKAISKRRSLTRRSARAQR